MARKNKRQQVRKPQRGVPGPRSVRPAAPGSVAPPDPGSPPPAPPAVSSSPAPAPGPSPSLAARPRVGARRVAAGPLPSQDAAIPLERVPYFQADLRRIALTAGLMLALLIVGSFLIH